MGKLNEEFRSLLRDGGYRRLNPLALVVDDDPLCRKMTASYLKGFGIDVREAADGMEAWRAYVLDGDADIIVTDCDMPHKGGIELAQSIRDIQKNALHNQKPLIIMLSTHTDNFQESLRVGVDHQFIKGEENLHDRLQCEVKNYLNVWGNPCFAAENTQVLGV